MSETDCFRRGGNFRPSAINQNNSFKNENYLFELGKPKLKEKTRKTKQLSKTNDEIIPRAIAADVLSYSKIQEGMLILGCVRSVTELNVNVELPGRTFGKINVGSISESFRNRMLKFTNSKSADAIEEMENLRDMFEVGQFIPTKVIESKQTEKGMNVSLTMDPASIHYNYNHRSFDVGHLMWASVLEKSDHGYLLDVGVKNVRIMLPFQNIDSGKEYVDGEPLWCVVEKAMKTKEAITLTVISIKNVINSTTVNDCPLDNVIPGMCVDLCVERILQDGLEGKFMGAYAGFINDIYLESPFESKDRYVGQIVKAWVLYTQPMTKTTHLTLRNLDQVPPPPFKNGHILRAKIASKTGKGLILNLNSSERGFVTNKRLLKSLKLHANSDMEDIIKRSYGLNSTHQCRILDYIHMDRMYVCTFEQNVLKEALFTMKDVKVGEFVNVEIIEINRSGIVVKMGNFNGFITNEHLCDVSYSETMKRQFAIGQRLVARIWNVENGSSIKLTLKKMLMDAKDCLKSYDEVVKNAQYLGVVVKLTRQGALIKFFGGVQGWLKRMDDDDDNPNKDFSKMFYIGQVILTTVLNVEKNNRITLTLDPPKLSSHKQLRIGQVVNGVVHSMSTENVTVVVGPRKIKCIIPTLHLCESYSLATDILKTYRCGDEIRNLICISNIGTQVLSIREYHHFKKLKFPNLNNLQVGDLIRCSVKGTDDTRLYLTSPICYFNGDILVNREDITDIRDLVPELTFNIDQSFVCKIVNVDKKKNCIVGSMKLSEVFDYDLEYTVKRFHAYLSDVLRIKSTLVDLKNLLASFTIGEHVTCTIKNISSEGCVVSLPNGILGLVEVDHYPKKPLQIGQTVRGVVLWTDYVNKYVRVSLRNKIVDKVNKMQNERANLKCGQCVFADVLYVCNHFAICLLGREGNRQLAFIPTQLHENDFVTSVDYYRMSKNKKIKFKIFSLSDEVIVGFEKKLFNNVCKLAKKFSVRKRLVRDNDTAGKKNFSLENPTVRAHVQSKPAIQGSHNFEMSTIQTSNISDNDAASSKSEESDDEEDDIDSENDVASEEEVSDDDTKFRNIEENNVIFNNEDELHDDGSEAHDTNDENEEHDDADGSSAHEDDGSSAHEDDDGSSAHEDDDGSSAHEDDDGNSAHEGDDGTEAHDDESDVHDNDNTFKAQSEECVQESSELEEKTTTNMSSVKRKSNDVEKPLKKLKFSAREIRNFRELDIVTLPKMNPKAILPGVTNFFDCDDKMEMTSRVNDVPDMESSKSKKKKLTPVQQADFLLQEENLLRRKEEELADIERVPQSAEEFDKRLLAEPDSSKLWCQYGAFLLQTNEVSKARAIAKKALMTVRQTAIQDRLNIWIMYMSLENMHGTKESFDEVFNEAVRCNDALTVYLQALQILLTNPDPTHLEEKITKTRAKFKQEQKMYLAIAKIYYDQKRFSEARKLKDDGLRNIATNQQIPFIVQFAIMEMNLGEESHAESLFEAILQSDPKRIDVWFTYVDQLVKKEKFDLARRVLERAVGQKLSQKKMNSLFKKFEQFEDKHGTVETKLNLSKLLANYSSSFKNKES